MRRREPDNEEREGRSVDSASLLSLLLLVVLILLLVSVTDENTALPSKDFLSKINRKKQMNCNRTLLFVLSPPSIVGCSGVGNEHNTTFVVIILSSYPDSLVNSPSIVAVQSLMLSGALLRLSLRLPRSRRMRI